MADWRSDGMMALRIGLGSALGGLSRVLVGAAWAEAPVVATASVNVSGALLMGLLHVVTLPDGRLPLSVSLRQTVLAGFLGGFTTFSILSLETLLLLQTGAAGLALVNLGGSLSLALLAGALGHRWGERLNTSQRVTRERD